jgi:DNA-binding XRE family transcriptional regulator
LVPRLSIRDEGGSVTYEEMKLRFAKQLRDARTALGLTQQDVAEDIGASIGTVRNWEQGIDLPNFEKYLWLCLRFGWQHEFADVASQGSQLWPGNAVSPLGGSAPTTSDLIAS